MLLITYDIESDKTRTDFSKFLKKFGRRIQYSVFEIKNSPRVIGAITTELTERYEKRFTGADSVLIFTLCEGCMKKTLKFGFPKTEDHDIVFL